MPIQIIVALLFVLGLILMVTTLISFGRKKMRALRPNAAFVKEAYNVGNGTRLVVVEYDQTRYVTLLSQNSSLLLDKKKVFPEITAPDEDPA